LPSDCAAEEGILEEAGVVKKDRIVVIRACDFECLRETLDALWVLGVGCLSQAQP
jgi:hypothetical protein